MSTPRTLPSERSKIKFTVSDKRKMWKQFDESAGEDIDCIYNKEGDRDACDLCGFPLLLRVWPRNWAIPFFFSSNNHLTF